MTKDFKQLDYAIVGGEMGRFFVAEKDYSNSLVEEQDQNQFYQPLLQKQFALHHLC
jgi:hypothetical protein